MEVVKQLRRYAAQIHHTFVPCLIKEIYNMFNI